MLQFFRKPTPFKNSIYYILLLLGYGTTFPKLSIPKILEIWLSIPKILGTLLQFFRKPTPFKKSIYYNLLVLDYGTTKVPGM